MAPRSLGRARDDRLRRVRDWLLRSYRSWFHVLLALVVVGLVGLAWLHRFIQDDAFISFRYAENLTGGRGLVWNPGERVEGYTNFLWTLLLALPFVLHLDPVAFVYAVGLVLFALSLLLTYRAGVLVTHSRDAALLATVFLGLNYTFSAYATGGLETQLQACLFVGSACVLFRLRDSVRVLDTALLSLLLGGAMLTRLDSAVVGLVFFLVAFWTWMGQGRVQARGIGLLALVTPAVVLAGGWLGWKWSYYGDLLPNTFYAKVSVTSLSLATGLHYLYLFWLSYLLFPFVFMLLLAAKHFRSPRAFNAAILLIVLLLWSLYIALVGGDFMEFRLLVPILPLLMVLIGWLILNVVQPRPVQVALALLVLAGALHHPWAFGRSVFPESIEPIPSLAARLQDPGQNWDGIGQVLGQALDQHPEVVIATSAAGAIPFYSRLTTVDMLGLNDRWVARNGPVLGGLGLYRIASFDYLVERKVNLLIGHPWMRYKDDTSPAIYSVQWLTDDRSRLPDLDRQFCKMYAQRFAGLQVIEVPIAEDYRLVVFYLTPSPVVEEAIHRNGWAVYTIAGD